MSNKMLIDAIHPEETRVVVVRDKRVEDFDFEAASKKPLRGNIYLAKVTRVEPSLQAAFIEYGGNRHGFLAFSEIHPDYYQIPQADRAALIADERGQDDEEEERGGGSSSGGNSGRNRRRRGGRNGRRDGGSGGSEARASRDSGGSDDEDGVGGVTEIEVEDDEDDLIEVAGAADQGDSDDDREQDDDGPTVSGLADDAFEDEGANDSIAATVEGAGAEDDRPVAPRPATTNTGDVTSGDIEADVDAGVSSDEEPAALDRARQQVEENIRADVDAAIDDPIREVEVTEPTATPDADSESKTHDDAVDPPVARKAAASEAKADAAPGEAEEAPAPARKPARPRRSRAAPKTAAAAKAAEEAKATEEPKAAEETKPTKAAATKDAPAEAAATDEGADGEAPAPKKKRRAPAKRTTKKSADGLADPQVSDDDDFDGSGDDDAGSITSMGGDAGDEIPERRRSQPRRQYKIQEVIKRRQILLVQVVKEERGTKGAALTTYLSLAGRYSVLMPNTDRGGGVSRKITDNADRRRLKELVEELEVPEGMGIILRTAGAARTKTEIRRDFEYLIRLWESVRELTLKSIAPQLVYEEGNLVKRAIRDLYSKEIDEILVSGDSAYREASDFMQMLMPSHSRSVKPYRGATPIFTGYGVESQLDAMFSPQVTLPSKGYIVINPTEALVSIDVNSGRSTKEHSIEDTALKTNLEAADEVARQLRLRDLAGLIVIDFIDMDEKRHNRAVEKRLKDALRLDRSRIQIGRISPFGLLEMSRQRMRQGMVETSMVPCATCGGTGHVRSTPSVALHCLRSLEEHLLKNGDHHVTIKTSSSVALYILNQKRGHLNALEERFALEIGVDADETLTGQHLEIIAGALAERGPDDVPPVARIVPEPVTVDDVEFENDDVDGDEEDTEVGEVREVRDAEGDGEGEAGGDAQQGGERSGRRRRRRRRRGGNGDGPRNEDAPRQVEAASDTVLSDDQDDDEDDEDDTSDETLEAGEAEASGDDRRDDASESEEDRRSRRRRGRRGGRRHRREGEDRPALEADRADGEDVDVVDRETDGPDVIDGPVPSRPEDMLHNGAEAGDDAAPSAEVTFEEPESAEPEAAASGNGSDAEDDADEGAEAPRMETNAAPEQKSDSKPRRSGWWQRRSFF